MVFATFWYFNVHVGFLRVSLGFHVGFHLGGFFRGGSSRVSLEFYLGFHIGFHARVSYQDFLYVM